EKEIDYAKEYPGKNNAKAVWKEGNFPDGQVNNLALFQGPNNAQAVVYVHRVIDCPAATEIAASFGSDDTLSVWLNGERIISQNEYRAVAPDQAKAILKLKAGKNSLLLKICQGEGEWSFYFAAGNPEAPI